MQSSKESVVLPGRLFNALLVSLLVIALMKGDVNIRE